MKLIHCGDVVGKAGRRAILEHIPDLRRRLDLDFVIVNGENAARGFGITAKILQILLRRRRRRHHHRQPRVGAARHRRLHRRRSAPAQAP